MSGNQYQDEVTWDTNEGPTELHVVVKEFFEKYLHRVEESDGGIMFNPITINCCRVLMMEPLSELLERMRELAGARPNPLDRHRSET